MKKKILSLTAVVLAMAMTTTSVFAAITPRDDADVDGDGAVTANDVEKIINGAENGNFDGDTGVTPTDAKALMYYILQPKNVTEKYGIRVSTSTEFLGGAEVKLYDNLGDTTPDNRGFNAVSESGPLTPSTKITEAIDQLKNNLDPAKVSSTLNKIQFHSEKKGDVKLSEYNGWIMFRWAVSPIVPMDADMAKDANKTLSADENVATAPADKQARAAALDDVAAKLGIPDAEGKANTISLTADDLGSIITELYKAFPNDITEDEIRAAAERVINITVEGKGGSGKYTFTYAKNDEAPTAIDAKDCAFVNDVVAFAKGGWQDKTIEDARTTFGDKVTLTSTLKGGQPKSATVEIYKRIDTKNLP